MVLPSTFKGASLTCPSQRPTLLETPIEASFRLSQQGAMETVTNTVRVVSRQTERLTL